MKIICKTLPITNDYYICRFFPENAAFFDIETTGFSAKSAFVYLIGMAIRKGKELEIYQFLAENRQDESLVLQEFFAKIITMNTILCFNGTGFDIPFLNTRSTLYSLHNPLPDIPVIDLYKCTGKLKNFLQLADRKQKTLESFLGIEREDRYNGGELIRIYYEYEKSHSLASEHLLLIHNYEDVTGMIDLLSILSYQELFARDAKVTHAAIEEYLPFASSLPQKELLFSLEAPVKFPKQVLYQNELCNIFCQESLVKISVPILEGKIKYYHENYKDYYYLPDEDMAIHKSVATFVAPSHRKKATAETCYTKLALTEDFLHNTNSLASYVTSLLKKVASF